RECRRVLCRAHWRTTRPGALGRRPPAINLSWGPALAGPYDYNPRMRVDHHYWHSPRLEHDMGVAVFGHWGPPLLAFPTSHGDEWELQRHGLIDAIGDLIDAGRLKVFCVGSNNQDSYMNR